MDGLFWLPVLVWSHKLGLNSCSKRRIEAVVTCFLAPSAKLVAPLAVCTTFVRHEGAIQIGDSFMLGE